MIGFSEDATPYGARLDKTAFFAWVQRQEGGRYELKDGEIVMHAGSTERHARISYRFGFTLGTRLDQDVWSITSGEYAVEVGDDVRYPDTMVSRLSGDGHQLASKAPILLVEVLSPSSAGRDLNVKLAEYTSLASLDCYIVASQDEPIVWVWQRDAVTGAFPKLPAELSGPDASIAIESLGITLPLAEIYRGITGPHAR